MCSGRVQKRACFEDGDIVGSLIGVRMVRAIDGLTPGLYVSTVAASARLLSNEEADIMVGVIGGFEAA